MGCGGGGLGLVRRPAYRGWLSSVIRDVLASRRAAPPLLGRYGAAILVVRNSAVLPLRAVYSPKISPPRFLDLLQDLQRISLRNPSRSSLANLDRGIENRADTNQAAKFVLRNGC